MAAGSCHVTKESSIPLAGDIPSVSHATARRRRHTKMVALTSSLLLFGKSAAAFVAPKAKSSQRFCRLRPVLSRFQGDSTFPNYRQQAHSISRNKSRNSFPTRLYATFSGDDGSKQSVSSTERNLGILVLCTVPLAWGTFEPAVRYVYAIEPAVPGFVFSVGYYLVAALSLSALAFLSMLLQQNESYGNEDAESQQQKDSSPSLPILGGIELGTYLFLGNGLQVLGLKTIPSDRAAFLLQLTTVSFQLALTSQCNPRHC
jgi:hypothetical protein